MNELSKDEKIYLIKEKSIEIQKENLSDQVKNLENENTKSSLIIWFIGTIVALLWEGLWTLWDIEKIFLFLFFIIPMVLSLYNISSKKVKSHIWIDTVFVNRSDEYEAFLNNLHLSLRGNYEDVTKKLENKVNLTKIVYGFTIGLLIYILILKIF